jgi:hypothetical protein
LVFISEIIFSLFQNIHFFWESPRLSPLSLAAFFGAGAAFSAGFFDSVLFTLSLACLAADVAFAYSAALALTASSPFFLIWASESDDLLFTYALLMLTAPV